MFEKINYYKTYCASIDSVLLEVTTECNKNCSFCYNRNRVVKHLDSKELYLILRFLEKNNVKKLILSGGEPLVNKNIFKIIDFFCMYLENITIITNGYLIDKELFDKLKKYKNKIYLKISIELPHSEFIFSLVNILKNYDIRYSISITLYQNSVQELESFITRIRDVYSDFIEISFPIFKGNAKISEYEINNLKSILFFLLDLVIFKEEKIICEHVSSKIKEYFSSSKKQVSNCSICKKIKVDIDGKVYACPYFTSSEYVIGNLQQGIDLRKSILCLKKSINLRDRNKCKFCKWLNLCNGGCLVCYEGWESKIDYNCILNYEAFTYINKVFKLYK